MADFTLRPVTSDPDKIEFHQDFELNGKALDEETVTVLDDGDLLIEGYAASFDGLDREGENFVPGAFNRGIKSFLGGNRPLCFHHKKDQVIGEVLDLEEVDGKGLRMRARVDSQEKDSPLYHIYSGIKKRSITGLSVGGYFRRAIVNGRPMISDMDFVEISATGTPVHSGTHFAVVAGKALDSGIEAPAAEEVVEDDISDVDYAEVKAVVDSLSKIFDTLAVQPDSSSTD